MIQELRPAVFYATRTLGKAPGARIPRASQSMQAEALLKALRREAGISGGVSSKAHSRAAVAVALTESGLIGVDIEYVSGPRPIMEIAHWLMNADAPDVRSAYRAFTFREAYFKATGAWPARSLLHAVSAARATRYMLDDVQVLHEDVDEDFLLTLVGTSSAAASRLRV